MNICLVSHEYPPETPGGGIGSQTRNKATALARLGHTVHVLAAAPVDDVPHVSTVTDEGVIVHRIRPPSADIAIYGRGTFQLGHSWEVFRHLSRLMEKVEFDVVDFPEYGAEGFAYQLDRTSWNWLPVVIQLHGPMEMFVEHMGWPPREGRWHQLSRFCEKFSITQADALMSASANIADLTSRYYGVPRDSIEVVHCGVDAEKFRSGGRLADRPTVLFVGKIVENKGAGTVFDAVAQLRKKYPDIKGQFLGRFPDEYDITEYIRSRLATDGLEQNFEFTGFVEADQLPEYYRSAHVFCSPAQFEGGVANVYLEAMACGCPVVASTAGGGPEAVTDGETGHLVPPDDVAATADAIDQILSDSHKRQAMGVASRRRVEEYFSMDHHVRRVLNVYERAIARSREHPDRHKGLRE